MAEGIASDEFSEVLVVWCLAWVWVWAVIVIAFRAAAYILTVMMWAMCAEDGLVGYLVDYLAALLLQLPPIELMLCLVSLLVFGYTTGLGKLLFSCTYYTLCFL